jgi:hypothetical protein
MTRALELWARAVEALRPPKIVLRIGFASLAVVALFALRLPADAHISCNGNFQITKYGPIATPYCEEEQIAIVAQSYGWNVCLPLKFTMTLLRRSMSAKSSVVMCGSRAPAQAMDPIPSAHNANGKRKAAEADARCGAIDTLA